LCKVTVSSQQAMVSSKSNGFEDLKVWQKARFFAGNIYQTSKKFPKEDLYGITNQIRRASLSIASNIAEGCAKNSDKDFLRYIRISLGSAAELKCQLIIANDIKIIDNADCETLLSDLTEIAKMLKGLERNLVNKTSIDR